MDYFKDKQLKVAFSNTASQVVIKTITSFSTLLITLVIAYFFGIKMLGSFTKIITFVSFFYLFIDFNLNAVFLKDHYKNSEKLFTGLFLIRILFALIFFFLIGVISVFLPYDSSTDRGFSLFEKRGMTLFSLTLFIQAYVFSTNAIFQKIQKYNLLIMPNIFSFLTFLLFISIAIFSKNIFLLLLSFFFAGIVYIVFTLIKLQKRVYFSFLLKDFLPFSKKLITSSLPLGLMLIINLVYFKADIFILSFYKSSFDVGIYGFAYKIFEFVISFPAFFSNSVYPILIEQNQKSSNLYLHFKKFSILLFVLSIIAGLIIFFLAPIIKYFKSDLLLSVAPLRILIFSLPFFFLTSLFQWILIIKNRKSQLLVVYSVSAFLNIILNLILIPKYSFIGASLTTVISEIFVFVLLFLLIIRIKGSLLPQKEFFQK